MTMSVPWPQSAMATQATIDACHGCDVLIHEVQTLESLAKRRDFQPYVAKYHTNTTQLAELAGKAKPRLLIVYHASIVLRPGLRPQASSPEQVLIKRGAFRLRGRGGCRSRSRRLLKRSAFGSVASRSGSLLWVGGAGAVRSSRTNSAESTSAYSECLPLRASQLTQDC